MIWLLIVVYLGGDPVSVVDVKIAETFHSEQKCLERFQAIYKDAEQEEDPVPQNIVLGCTPFKRSIM
jgi:hypothetical protein